MSQEITDNDTLRLALPKGRMQDAVIVLLADAGIRVTPTARGYRPAVSLPDCEAKILKHQNIVEMLELGSRDVGFAGADWVEELGVEVMELLDTGLDPVSVVAAAPRGLFDRLDEVGRPLVIASEYETLTKAWIAQRGLDAEFVQSFGATEVFPPEDADVIVDNTATGSTLRANDLEIVDTVITSSTRLYASPQAMENGVKRERIEDLRLLLGSVLDARRRVMVEVNAPEDRLEEVVSLLPCMREATVAPLFGNSGYAVKAAVLRDELPKIIPAIKAAGGSDVVVTSISQIVP
ncbi:MAG: ATP phosphoribosyltransferase [Gemmatimonadota bacterium]|nr:ATP phosphoribosyltransferase [Gemmatimonadota bacterium]MED5564115.1 ATP phosphoribosyltransferase [Gemmatimonadota bacterium]|tara:strand:+ start:2445 stop:3323 length:879 start_codon:yes stop_codon:yes gene_type:complete